MTLHSLISKLIKGEKAIKAVTTTIKLLGAILGVIGSFYVGYRSVKAIMFNKWEKERKEDVRWQKIDKLLDSDSLRLIQYNQIMESLAGMSVKQDKTDRVMTNLKDYMMNKSATKEDLREVVRVFDEKKNEIQW